jgi:predicted Rossmann fold flavoprotein
MPPTRRAVDLAVVGAGAAGLMAAITAGRQSRAHGARLAIAALDGAATIGAKILVAGGGRCNVTHAAVDETAFAGSTRPAIRKILRRFGVDDTVRFFADLGVPLKRESTGKLFPVTDRARTVLDALLRAARDAGVEVVHPWRVEDVGLAHGGFVLRGPAGELAARRVVLATGGRSLPKSGSDGHGFELARRLGHTTTPRVFPGLVPLVLAEDCFIRRLAGVTLPAALSLRSGTGKTLRAFAGSTLCTHFGISGPPVLDISRYWIEARVHDPAAHLCVDWLPQLGERSLEGELARRGGAAVGAALRSRLPERLAEALCRQAGIDPEASFDRLARDARRTLEQTVRSYRLPVTGDRGFTHAEVTAGGVPLSETRLQTLESRICAGLHLAGEILDVDGRIGGFNFQWAWASGFVAGEGVRSPLSHLLDSNDSMGDLTPSPIPARVAGSRSLRGTRTRAAARRQRTP